MKVTAIVPVYNEEKTIGNVLKVLASSDKLQRIIVVDDGSTDNTPSIIRKFKVKVITLKKNTGKGNAVKKAAKYINSDTILMCDADLHGFNTEHIGKILEPIERNYASMCIGIRKNPVIGGYFIDKALLTGGERALLSPIFKKVIKNPLIERWGLESVLNYYCRINNYKIATINLKGVTHTLRAKKKNLLSFFKEILDVIVVRIKLIINNQN